VHICASEKAPSRCAQHRCAARAWTCVAQTQPTRPPALRCCPLAAAHFRGPMLRWAAPRAAACLQCGRDLPGPVSRPPACAKGQRRRGPGCRARRIGGRAEPAGWHGPAQHRAYGARGARAGRAAAGAAAVAGGARTPTDAASGLPISEVLGDVLRALDASGALVLQAPPGAGKTTAVPLALLLAAPAWLRGGLILVRRGAPGATRRRAGPRAKLQPAQYTGFTPAWHVCTPASLSRPLDPPAARSHLGQAPDGTAAFIQRVSVYCVAAGAPARGARGCGQPALLPPNPPAGRRAPPAGGARGRAAHGRAAGRARGRPRRLPHPGRRHVRAAHGRPGGHHRRAAAPPAARAPPRVAWRPAVIPRSGTALGCHRRRAAAFNTHARPHVARTLPRLRRACCCSWLPPPASRRRACRARNVRRPRAARMSHPLRLGTQRLFKRPHSLPFSARPSQPRAFGLAWTHPIACSSCMVCPHGRARPHPAAPASQHSRQRCCFAPRWAVRLDSIPSF